MFTFGHGRSTREELATLLRGARVGGPESGDAGVGTGSTPTTPTRQDTTTPTRQDTTAPTCLAGAPRTTSGEVGASKPVAGAPGAGVELVVDVRRYPGSSTNPAAARGEIESLATELGIGYRWDERLGGRRHLTREQKAASPDTWWEVEAFRSYSAWTRSDDFKAGLADLLAGDTDTTAIMCSEAVWWRCHRRIIADILVLAHDIEVHHLLPGGRIAEHKPSAGARVTASGLVVWDGPAATR